MTHFAMKGIIIWNTTPDAFYCTFCTGFNSKQGVKNINRSITISNQSLQYGLVETNLKITMFQFQKCYIINPKNVKFLCFDLNNLDSSIQQPLWSDKQKGHPVFSNICLMLFFSKMIVAKPGWNLISSQLLLIECCKMAMKTVRCFIFPHTKKTLESILQKTLENNLRN